MRRQLAGWLLASLAVGLGGCQSWSQVGQGIPGGSRVPPPGTGTYPVPSSYYNNGAAGKTGAVSSNAQPAAAASMASGSAAANNTTAARTTAQPLPTTGGAPVAATTANWQIPTVDQVRTGINSTANAVFDDVGNQANQVVQAGTARAAAAVEKYTDPAPSLRPAGAQTSTRPSASSAQSNLATAPPTAPVSRSLSDSPAGEEPQLDWQAPQ